MPGSHGALTKAGKVRNQTPKVPCTGINSKKKKIPRIRNRENYKKRVIKLNYAGQPDSMGAQKHQRRVRATNRE
ncbi:MAG: 30S ribosomal protein S30e [Promethearchaeota archaeon]